MRYPYTSGSQPLAWRAYFSLPSRVVDSVSEVGPGICISNKLPGAAGLENHALRAVAPLNAPETAA